ncbi:restriction endonuclease [Rhodoferax sp.]|uniref:restriction endonuclease n=1 Tax=Rhodoferax sp. TaxID=50421 RepID=UPI0039B8D4D5
MVDAKYNINDQVFVCGACGYWGGRGTRDEGGYLARGAVGRYRPLLPLTDQETDYLVTHLTRKPRDVLKLSATRAEKFTMDLLRDYLQCEVEYVGGTRDGGVDGYLVSSDNHRTLVQVKWRQDENCVESVLTVRTVAGTLLARGVPEGLLVSTASHFSTEARKVGILVDRDRSFRFVVTGDSGGA